MAFDEGVKIRGEVEAIHVIKDEGRWCAFLFRQDTGDRITVVGTFPDIRESSAMEIEGKWVNHPRFGRQLKATSYVLVVPTSKDGIRTYLDWALPQIGPQRSRRIVDEFGEESLSVLENSPEKLLVIPGINEERLRAICTAWKEGAPKREAYIYLARFGLTQAMTEGVIAYFGDSTVDVVSKDPYVLTEVSGLGFNKVDEVALRMGIGVNSPERRRAALLYLFRSASTRGHVYLSIPDLCQEMRSLSLPHLDKEAWTEGEIQVHVDYLREQRFLIQESNRIYMRDLYLSEVYSAYLLQHMLRTPVGCLGGALPLASTPREGEALESPLEWFSEGESADTYSSSGDTVSDLMKETPEGQLFPDSEIERFIEEYQKNHGIELSAAQKHALTLANQNRVFLLTGLPGTGKTTVLKAVMSLYERAMLSVQLCAPTGKAAKRLGQVAGRKASTIHRYLGSGRGGQWAFNEASPAPDHVIIVDEFSMVDTTVLHRLLCALSSNHYLVMVGDPGQLSSVGPGSVLADMIHSGKIPRVHLEEIFRQSAESSIVVNAHHIHRGEKINSNLGPDFSVFTSHTSARAVSALIALCTRLQEKSATFQVITPKRKDAVGTNALNETLKPILNPLSENLQCVEWSQKKFHVGDRVIVTRNNYKKKVFNGDIGVVIHTDPFSRKVKVLFSDLEEEIDPFDERNQSEDYLFKDGRLVVIFQGTDLVDLELAYALTVHKSQGSEWDIVVLLMLQAHGRMLRRRLLYTAVTRAKKKLIIIQDTGALGKAIANNLDDRRNTSLGYFLQEDSDSLSERIDGYYDSSYQDRSGIPSLS